MLCAGAFLPGPSLSSVLIFPFSFPTSTLDLPFLLGSLVPARPLHAVPSSPGSSLEPKRCRMVGLPRAAAQRRMRVGEPRAPGGGKPHYSGARRKLLRTLPGPMSAGIFLWGHRAQRPCRPPPAPGAGWREIRRGDHLLCPRAARGRAPEAVLQWEAKRVSQTPTAVTEVTCRLLATVSSPLKRGFLPGALRCRC